METPYRAASQIRLDHDGRILDDDLTCLHCGYNLRSLLPDGACPECGTAVARSIHGAVLRFCDPDWVGQLALGMKLLIASIVTQFLLVCLSWFLMRTMADPSLAGTVRLVPAVLGLIGYWKLTTPDPGKTEAAVGLDARQVTRAATVTGFVLSVASLLAGGEVANVIPIALGLAVAAIQLVATFATFIYARQLAIRIPDIPLADHTRWVMWGWAVSYLVIAVLLGLNAVSSVGAGATSGGRSTTLFVGACMSIAMLILAIFSLILVIRYLNAFNRAARQARATWAADPDPDAWRARRDEARRHQKRRLWS